MVKNVYLHRRIGLKIVASWHQPTIQLNSQHLLRQGQAPAISPPVFDHRPTEFRKIAFSEKPTSKLTA